MKNIFKSKLLENKQQIGLWLSLANSYSAELCASSDFDWLLIDGEHSPNDIQTTLAQLQAISSYNAQAVVRIPHHDPDYIKMILDIGVTNILVPMVSTTEQAEAIVRSVRYPPVGQRGIGHMLGRASRWGRDTEYFANWSDECCIIVQIETKAGLEQLEAILSVDGIDGLLIGPADLAADLGYPGEMGDPVVLAAIDDAIARARALGCPVGVLSVGVEPSLRYFAQGCSFVAAGADVLLLAHAADHLSQTVRNRLNAQSQ